MKNRTLYVCETCQSRDRKSWQQCCVTFAPPPCSLGLKKGALRPGIISGPLNRSSVSCRKQHREEVVKLQQQLKSTSASTKGGAVEAERAKKDLEKTRWASDHSDTPSINGFLSLSRHVHQ